MGGGPAYYAGASGIREFFRDVAESWESFRFEATDLRDLGDRVLREALEAAGLRE